MCWWLDFLALAMAPPTEPSITIPVSLLGRLAWNWVIGYLVLWLFTWPTPVAVMDPIPDVISRYVPLFAAAILILISEPRLMPSSSSTPLEKGRPNPLARDTVITRNGLQFTRKEVTIEEFEKRGTEESDFQEYLRKDWVPPIDVAKAYWSADDKKSVLEAFARYVWRSTHRLCSATNQVDNAGKQIEALTRKIDRLTADLATAEKKIAVNTAVSTGNAYIGIITNLVEQFRTAMTTPRVKLYQAPNFETCFSMNRCDWMAWTRDAQYWLAANSERFLAPSGPGIACYWFCSLLSGDAKLIAQSHTAIAIAKGTAVLAVQELIDCLGIAYHDPDYQQKLRNALRNVSQGSSSFRDYYLRFRAANCHISPSMSEQECKRIFLDGLHPNLLVELELQHISSRNWPVEKTIEEMAPLLSHLDRIAHYTGCEDDEHDHSHTGSTCKYGKSQEDCKRDSEAATAREKRTCGCPGHYTGPGRQCRDRGSHK